MDIYLIQPYNAYVKSRKKTSQEEIFEQNEIAEMQYKILMQEELYNRTLPNNSPAVASATAGPMQQMGTGGGGQPNPEYFNPIITNISFSAQPITGIAPLTVQFTNQSSFDALSYDSWCWNFLSASAIIGKSTSPSFTFPTGTFNVSLTGSSTDPSITTSQSYYSNVISASIPIVLASFTISTSSISHPSTTTFVNTTTYNGSGTLTYLWSYGTSSYTSTQQTLAPLTYVNAGPYTASLQVTESTFNIMSYYTQSWRIT